MKLPPTHCHTHGRRPDQGFPGFVVPGFDREPDNWKCSFNVSTI